MKKIFILLCLTLCIIPCVSAKEYNLPKDDIKIELSDDFSVITKENYKDDVSYDKFVEYFGFDENYTQDYFVSYIELFIENYDFVLVALNKNKGYSLTVEVRTTNISKDNLTYSQMLELEDTIVEGFSNELGVTVNESHITKIKEIPVFYAIYKNQSYYTIHYYLVHNGRAYNFIFESQKQLNSNDCLEILEGVTILNYNYPNDEDNLNYFLIIVTGCISLILVAVVIKFFKKKKTKY